MDELAKLTKAFEQALQEHSWWTNQESLNKLIAASKALDAYEARVIEKELEDG